MWKPPLVEMQVRLRAKDTCGLALPKTLGIVGTQCIGPSLFGAFPVQSE